MDLLLLRFDAPLMSFGGVMVDQHGPTERFPGLSLLAGLFGNALGYRHGDDDKLEALQARIEYAARWDVPPEPLLDYHTVDLGPPKDVNPERWYKMREPGWTTRGEPEHRAGGTAAFGTHQRYRHYWANGVMTLAVGLMAQRDAIAPGDVIPTPGLDDLAAALQAPARPLFLGRKTCLPSVPLLIRKVEAADVLAALRQEPRIERCQQGKKTDPLPPQEGQRVQACWPARLGVGANAQEVPVYDRRDWRNQIHAGRRVRVQGWLELAQ
ncbi:CRISPR system Cascade subunit CasD [Myxococcaceae bacterium]|nr:CRISPR system Cascade subunit CasD [Myxococcaceae bacterium]